MRLMIYYPKNQFLSSLGTQVYNSLLKTLLRRECDEK